MTFVDEVRIFLKAGDGGKGCESFYQDKYTRYPRPDGGDGGKGGDIVFVADQRLHTLLDYRFRQHYKAERGGHASSKGKKGREGGDLILRVPLGTIIRDLETETVIKDLTFEGQRVVVAKGGRGGQGNKNNRTPSAPKLGEEKVIHLELKLIADVGLIGFPNAGKSTIISQVSKVKSRIANFPFTTKQPVLGVVEVDDGHFVMADLPGLIEGAHDGRGLGDKFLKHAERTTVLVHVVDMAGVDQRDPLEDYRVILEECEAYSEVLISKDRIVVANKMDLPEAEKNLKRFKKIFKEPIIEVSALNEIGLENLVDKIAALLGKKSSRG